MKKRNRKAIEESLKKCLANGVDEDTILEAERLLEIVKEEDEIIREINVAFQQKNIENLEELIKKFR